MFFKPKEAQSEPLLHIFNTLLYSRHHQCFVDCGSIDNNYCCNQNVSEARNTHKSFTFLAAICLNDTDSRHRCNGHRKTKWVTQKKAENSFFWSLNVYSFSSASVIRKKKNQELRCGYGVLRDEWMRTSGQYVNYQNQIVSGSGVSDWAHVLFMHQCFHAGSVGFRGSGMQ